MSQSAGCSGSIALGQTKTCTVTNDDNAPKLTLVKHVVNDNGGTAVAAMWNLAAAGPTGFDGAGPSVSSGAGFDAGSYDLSESGPAGYDASAWVCSAGQVDGDTVSVGLGDDVTCTITNDDVAGDADRQEGRRQRQRRHRDRSRLLVPGERRHGAVRSRPTARTT